MHSDKYLLTFTVWYKSCLSPHLSFAPVESHMVWTQPPQLTAACIHRGYTKSYLQYTDMLDSISMNFRGIHYSFNKCPCSCLLSTCPCKSLAGAGAATCPPLSWFPEPTEHARWPAPGGRPVSAAVSGRGSCRPGDWPPGGAVVPERCFPAAAPLEARPPGLDDLEGRDQREKEGGCEGGGFGFLCTFRCNSI